MVPVGGLEPPSREAVDFESTEFTISPHGHKIKKVCLYLRQTFLKVKNYFTESFKALPTLNLATVVSGT